MWSRTEKIAAIAAELRDYLSANPHAADSLAGVMGWWLAGGNDMAPGDVEEALRQLQQEGIVELRRLSAGAVIYSARPRPPG